MSIIEKIDVSVPDRQRRHSPFDSLEPVHVEHSASVACMCLICARCESVVCCEVSHASIVGKIISPAMKLVVAVEVLATQIRDIVDTVHRGFV